MSVSNIVSYCQKKGHCRTTVNLQTIELEAVVNFCIKVYLFAFILDPSVSVISYALRLHTIVSVRLQLNYQSRIN